LSTTLSIIATRYIQEGLEVVKIRVWYPAHTQSLMER
jgi:hypothetical protein